MSYNECLSLLIGLEYIKTQISDIGDVTLEKLKDNTGAYLERLEPSVNIITKGQVYDIIRDAYYNDNSTSDGTVDENIRILKNIIRD